MTSKFTVEQLAAMQKNTKNFLQSYRIQKAMSTVSGFDEDESCETADKIELVEKTPFDTELAVGQIRLLCDVSRITYVVLLRRWEEDSFLTMAFSHYDFPATDEEFKPAFDGGIYLNTLQVWNTRTLRDETLCNGWCIGTMPQSDCDDAWTFWSHLITGRSLPEHILSRMGMPVTEANDERIGYIEEELSVFRKIEAADNATERIIKKSWNPWMTKKLVLPSLWERERSTMGLAAASEEKDIVKNCSIDGFDEIINICYSPHEKKLRVNVYDANEEDESTRFDGWFVVGVEGDEIGKITNSFCVADVPVLNVAAFALREECGTLHALALKTES